MSAQRDRPAGNRQRRPAQQLRSRAANGLMVKVNITMPTEIFDQVHEIALAEDRSMSGMITRLCRQALDQYDLTERVQPRTPDDEAAWQALQKGQ